MSTTIKENHTLNPIIIIDEKILCMIKYVYFW
jgi:hypothetical protein